MGADGRWWGYGVAVVGDGEVMGESEREGWVVHYAKTAHTILMLH